MSQHKKILLFVLGGFILFLFFCVITLMVTVKNTGAIVFQDDLTCQYREKVYVDRFIKRMDGELIDRYLVDTSVVGKRQIEVRYRNRYGFVEQKKIEIEVKDVTAPMIVVSNPYTVVEGEVDNLLDSIFCADDYDDDIKCVISGEYNLNVIGRYSLSIEAVDKSGNQTEKEFVLNVIKKSHQKESNKKNEVSFQDIYKRYKSSNTEVGLDISKWQGEVDFDKIVREGASFVMIKIGGQNGIGEEIIEDSYFSRNIEEALKHQLKVGVYFYSHAKTDVEAIKQARWVVQKLKKYSISLPVAFDWENWESYSKYRIGFRTLNHVASSFMDEVRRYGYQAMLYSSKYYLENIWYPELNDRWIAYYTNDNDYDDSYMMWQLCNTGKIDGIEGYVDIDILYLS